MLQFLLQLFIIFSRGDRQPSALQLATLTASLFTLISTGMDDYMMTNHPKDLNKELSRKKNLLPIFLSSTIFKLGSVAVMAATLKYWFVLCYIVPFIGGAILISCCGNRMRYLTRMFESHPLRLKLKNDPSWTKKNAMENCLFCNVVWFLCFSNVLIVITILANYSPDTNLNLHSIEFSLLKLQGHHLSSIAIVKNISLLSTISTVVMVSGVVSISLIYWEYRQARAEEEERECRSNLEES